MTHHSSSDTTQTYFISICSSIITSEHSPIDRPLLYVSSTGSGSLSIYEIVEATPGPI